MLRGYLFIATAACCWAFIGIFGAIAFSQGLEPMEVAFWRAFIAWFFFAAQAVVRNETQLDRKDIPLLLFFGFFGIFVFYVAYQYSVKTGGAALAAVLLYTAPAWVVICSYFLYRERLNAAKVLAVVLVIAGVYLIARSGGTGNRSGALSFSFIALATGLISGLCYSLYYIVGKYFSGRYSSGNLFLYVLPIGAICIFPMVDFAPKSLAAWAALFGLAIISTYLANICYYLGVKHLEAGRASIVATLEPVVATGLAYIILGESFTLPGYIGAALIVAAVALTILNR